MSPNDPEATRMAILDAAERLFSEKGFSGTSMSELAASAGVHQSLIHHHFGAKRELWNLVVTRYIQQYLESQTNALQSEQVSVKALESALEAEFRFWLARPDLLRLETWASLERDSPIAEPPGSMCAPFVPVIQAMQRAKIVRDDVEPTSLIVVAAGAVTYWVQKRQEIAVVLGRPASKDLDDRFLGDMLKLLSQGWEVKTLE